MKEIRKVRFLDNSTPPHILTLILLAAIQALAMNIFLPSLPNMTGYFDTEYRVLQLSVAVYLAVSAVLQLIIGPVSDKYGRRPVILAGLVLFLVATLGCMLSTSAEMFLGFRMMQASVVVTMVLSRAIISDIAPPERAASMIAYVTMGMAVVPMIGPAIGGILDESFGWKSNFVLLIILGTLILWLSWRDLGETAPKSDNTLGQQFREYPELFMSQRFWGYALASGFASGVFFAYLGGAPFVGSEVYSLSPKQVGFYFGAPAVGYFLGNFFSGKFSSRIGVNNMVFWGSIVNLLGVLLSTVCISAGYSHPLGFFGFMIFVGLGNGMTIPNATAGMLAVRPHLAGTASGLGGAIMIAGGATLSALAGILLAPGTGAYPLLWIMLSTAMLSIIAICYVIYREKQLAQQ